MKRITFAALALAAAAACAPGAVAAQTIAPADAIARLFTAPALQAAWFTPLFLAGVTLADLKTDLASMVGALGPYQSIAPNGDGYAVTFARGSVQATATLDASGAFTALYFGRMQSAPAAERVIALFRTTPIPADWFSPRVLNVLPIDRIRAIAAALLAKYGAFQQVVPAPDGTYTVTFTGGTASVNIFLGGNGKIEALLVRPH
jgi:hypothetical protein